MMQDDDAFWLTLRQALLLAVDAIERNKLPTVTRTADLRRELRQYAPARPAQPGCQVLDECGIIK